MRVKIDGKRQKVSVVGIGYISINLLLVPSYPGKSVQLSSKKRELNQREKEACFLSVLKREKLSRNRNSWNKTRL